MKVSMKILCLLLAATAGFAETRVSIGINVGGGYGYYPPPPASVYVYETPCPGPGYVWVPGYWYGVGPRYSWRHGYWAPPRYGDLHRGGRRRAPLMYRGYDRHGYRSGRRGYRP